MRRLRLGPETMSVTRPSPSPDARLASTTFGSRFYCVRSIAWLRPASSTPSTVVFHLRVIPRRGPAHIVGRAGSVDPPRRSKACRATGPSCSHAIGTLASTGSSRHRPQRPGMSAASRMVEPEQDGHMTGTAAPAIDPDDDPVELLRSDGRLRLGVRSHASIGLTNPLVTGPPPATGPSCTCAAAPRRARRGRRLLQRAVRRVQAPPVPAADSAAARGHATAAAGGRRPPPGRRRGRRAGRGRGGRTGAQRGDGAPGSPRRRARRLHRSWTGHAMRPAAANRAGRARTQREEQPC